MPWFPTLIATWPTPHRAQRTTSSAAAAGSIARRWRTRPLGLCRVEPDGRRGRRPPREEPVQQGRGRPLDQEERRVLGPDEALLLGVLEQGEEPGPVAADVDQADRLLVNAELGPGEDLEDLLERPEAARQRHEAVRERRHHGLALVHRAHQMQRGEPDVRVLLPGEAARQHADRLAAGGEDGVREDAHQPDRPAAVDEAEAAVDQRAGHRPGGLRVHGLPARCRPTEDADALHRSSGSSAKRFHSPGTPFRVWRPRSRKRRPEPATRSLTVLDTSTSPGAALAATLAPMWTARPETRSSRSSTSPSRAHLQAQRVDAFAHGTRAADGAGRSVEGGKE